MSDTTRKIFYEDIGDKNKRTIIFIHGWTGDHNHAKDISLRYYEKDFRCIYVDVLGYGQSDDFEIKKGESITMQSIDAIANMIFELKLKQVIICGFCTGGVIGWLLGDKYPQLVDAFIWVDGYLYVDPEYRPFLIPFIRYPLYNFIFKTKLGLNIINHFVNFSDSFDPDFYNRQKTTPTRTTLSYLKDMYYMTTHNFIAKVSRFTVPSLFIIGENTMDIVKRSQNYWIGNNKFAKGAIVTKSKHLTAIENPDELNFKIREYIDIL